MVLSRFELGFSQYLALLKKIYIRIFINSRTGNYRINFSSKNLIQLSQLNPISKIWSAIENLDLPSLLSIKPNILLSLTSLEASSFRQRVLDSRFIIIC